MSDKNPNSKEKKKNQKKKKSKKPTITSKIKPNDHLQEIWPFFFILLIMVWVYSNHQFVETYKLTSCIILKCIRAHEGRKILHKCSREWRGSEEYRLGIR